MFLWHCLFVWYVRICFLPFAIQAGGTSLTSVGVTLSMTFLTLFLAILNLRYSFLSRQIPCDQQCWIPCSWVQGYICLPVKMQRCIQCTLDFVQCIRDIHQLASVVHASLKVSANRWYSVMIWIHANLLECKCPRTKGSSSYTVTTVKPSQGQGCQTHTRCYVQCYWILMNYWWIHMNSVLFFVVQYWSLYSVNVRHLFDLIVSIDQASDTRSWRQTDYKTLWEGTRFIRAVCQRFNVRIEVYSSLVWSAFCVSIF